MGPQTVVYDPVSGNISWDVIEANQTAILGSTSGWVKIALKFKDQLMCWIKKTFYVFTRVGSGIFEILRMTGLFVLNGSRLSSML